MCDEQLEGLIELVVDVLCLHLLCDQVRDDGVHPGRQEYQIIGQYITLSVQHFERSVRDHSSKDDADEEERTK